MGTFNYKLRPSAKSPHLIRIQFSYGKKKLYRATTGFYVNEKKNWVDQKIKKVIAEPNANEWNKKLSALKEHFNKGYEELLTEGEVITNDHLKQIQELFVYAPQSIKKKEAFNLISLLDDWFDYTKNVKRNRKGQRLSPGTVKSVQNSVVTIKEFLKSNKVVSAKRIDDLLYQKLINFLESKGDSTNNVGKVVKNFKVFLRYLKENQQHRLELPNYIPSNWIVTKEEAFAIYLTNEELMKMYFLDLSGVKESYSIARDLFLISAFTGLRVSDNKRLEKKHIMELEAMRFFKIKSKKTGKDVYCPINEVVEEILSRNNGIPKRLADQQINRLIKEIAEWTGLDSSVTYTVTRGGVKSEVTKYKYELVKTHTGRMSYCTNAYKGGMDAISIMAVSGHTTEENFLNYIKLTDEEMAVRNAKHEYNQSLSPKNFNPDGSHKLKAVV